MTNSNNTSPNNQSMGQSREMPLEAIINNAFRDYTSMTDGSSSPEQPSMTSTWYQFKANINPSNGGSANTPQSLARGHLRCRLFLQNVWNRPTAPPTPTRGFSAHRSFIKSVWDRAEATSKNSGADTSATILNPNIQSFTPFPYFRLRRLESEDVVEDDCGFPYCGGFCALYPPRAANDDNNEAWQQVSSSAVQHGSGAIITPSQNIQLSDEEESDLEAGYKVDWISGDDFLDHDAIYSAYSSMLAAKFFWSKPFSCSRSC
ncbi:hypothetical protein BELL_0355g00010 [Botrytis elliptica]|uniref:Uncharacterized protein n=1 Tax=Botrytis elliptica TaxID=278938 RepID=A0A4Z1JJK5_9HELO|nr:hypothetical protein EAE99_011633 [Botrytis elliptica]TGO73504.1 hypothetical protein BELL_0355g00010 [Botrytis elliptica]